MEFALSNTHWLDAFTPPLEKQLQRLAETVLRLLAQETNFDLTDAEVPLLTSSERPIARRIPRGVDDDAKDHQSIGPEMPRVKVARPLTWLRDFLKNSLLRRLRMLIKILLILIVMIMGLAILLHYTVIDNQKNREATSFQALLGSGESERPAGMQKDDIMLYLSWDNRNALDLQCIDPYGEEICYNHKKTSSGGALYGESNFVEPTTDKPLTCIEWGAGFAPIGHYQVFIKNVVNNGGADPANYDLGVYVGNRYKFYKGKISYGEPKKLVCEFDLQMAPGAVRKTPVYMGK